jgi:ADP-dependent NAD(P)H-hydrate dehydratase / NAD(P)H-hydrate epimerase
MLPILSAAQMRATDQHTIAGGIPSFQLMERAAGACADRILQLHAQGDLGDPQAVRYVVIAGMGNNGGDGLVIACHLAVAGLKVRVIRLLHQPDPSPDHAVAFKELQQAGILSHDLQEGEELVLEKDEVVIDALFGTGLSRPISGWLATIVRRLNASHQVILSVDMPSGLFDGDNRDNDLSSVVQASVTFTFEVPKLSQLLADNAHLVGRLVVLPIGLDHSFMAMQQVAHHLVQEDDVAALLPPRPWHGHKGTFGHTLLIGGSKGKAGAMVICAKAALRAGSGLVTAHVPEQVLPVVQNIVPEAMCSAGGEDEIESPAPHGNHTAVGAGPGLGTGTGAAGMLKRLIQDAPAPLVLDADALNLLSENRTWLAFLPPGTILTPHPKEFDRLFGTPSRNGHERLERAVEVAVKHGVVVVLKGYITAICDTSGKVFFNSNGNPGMARGGSGDALTGIIAGLRARGTSTLQAAILGVWLHGSAGDIAAADKGMEGMSVMDLIEALPQAWQMLGRLSKKSLDGPLSLP